MPYYVSFDWEQAAERGDFENLVRYDYPDSGHVGGVGIVIEMRVGLTEISHEEYLATSSAIQLHNTEAQQSQLEAAVKAQLVVDATAAYHAQVEDEVRAIAAERLAARGIVAPEEVTLDG